jgi:hypothetical protein
METDTTRTRGRRLNHVEFVHRPGESALAVSLFEALGCSCRLIDTPPYGLYVVVDLDGSEHGNNDMFASQAEPEQLALEDELIARFAVDGDSLSVAASGFRAMMKTRAFRATHVGLRLPDISALDRTVDRLAALAAGPLANRLELGEPVTRTAEESKATSAPMKQLWIWTDVLSAGLLALGQQFELQAYDP